MLAKSGRTDLTFDAVRSKASMRSYPPLEEDSPVKDWRGRFGLCVESRAATGQNNSLLNNDFRNAITSSTISWADSKTMNFWPEVRVMTVSGVISICSIRSEFKIRAEWLSLVTFIIRKHLGRSRVWSKLHIDEKRGLYIPMWVNPKAYPF